MCPAWLSVATIHCWAVVVVVVVAVAAPAVALLLVVVFLLMLLVHDELISRQHVVTINGTLQYVLAYKTKYETYRPKHSLTLSGVSSLFNDRSFECPSHWISST